MSVQGIADNVLKDDLVPALQLALQSAGTNGIRKQKLAHVAKSVTGFWLSDEQFNQVMWIAHYETGTNGLYYANGNVPDEFKKEKKVKSKSDRGASTVGKPSPKSGSSQDFDDVDEVRIKKGKMVVTIKKVGKVSIFPILFILSLIGAHALGYI